MVDWSGVGTNAFSIVLLAVIFWWIFSSSNNRVKESIRNIFKGGQE